MIAALLIFLATYLFLAGTELPFLKLDRPEIFAQVDGTLLLFFAALFVVTHGVAQAGIAERLYRWLEPAFGADAVHQTFRFGAFTVAACQLVSVLELVGKTGEIPFRRFLVVGASATFLPLFVGLATLLAEQRLGFLSR